MKDSCAGMQDALPFFLVAEVSIMSGKYAVTGIVLTLILAGAALSQLRPAFGAEAQGQQMQMDMSGGADMGIPSYHAYALKPPFPATPDPKQFPDALNQP